MNILSKLAVVVVALGSMSVAQADPITFSFDMPEFQGSTLGGLTSTLEITVDNGNNSTVNQTYLNSQITGYDVTTGSLFASLNIFDDLASLLGSPFAYIMTDCSGIPTLDLSASIDTHFWLKNDDYFIQLGTRSGTGPTQYSVGFYIEGSENLVGFYADNISVRGTQVSVPEPGTLALFGIGLFGMGLARRRRKV